MSHDVTGDAAEDTQSLTILLSHYQEACEEFEQTPGPDELSDVEGWAHASFTYASKLEDRYGPDRTNDMFRQSWQEVRNV